LTTFSEEQSLKKVIFPKKSTYLNDLKSREKKKKTQGTSNTSRGKGHPINFFRVMP